MHFALSIRSEGFSHLNLEIVLISEKCIWLKIFAQKKPVGTMSEYRSWKKTHSWRLHSLAICVTRTMRMKSASDKIQNGTVFLGQPLQIVAYDFK